jgi:CheY-like chemotaxis protein
MPHALIIDDVEVTRYTCRTCLEELGLSADEAIDSQQALEKARGKRANVILLDWHLRKDSGLDIIGELRQTAGNVSIVVMSGVESESHQQQALNAGADAFAAKPTTTESLREALKKVRVL